MERVNVCAVRQQNADANQGKSLQINDQASDDVRCGSLDTDEKRGRTIGKGRDRMLRWILGVSLRDRRRNENIREVLGVACITDKVHARGKDAVVWSCNEEGGWLLH